MGVGVGVKAREEEEGGRRRGSSARGFTCVRRLNATHLSGFDLKIETIFGAIDQNTCRKTWRRAEILI